MSRYAKPGQTIEDLKRMIEDNGGVKEIVYNDKLKVHKDLLKVDMGFDVVDFIPESAIGNPFQMVNGNGDYPIAWCYANDEGEQPIMFVLYIGQEGKLRAYIPDSGNNICNAHTRHKETFEGTVYGGEWDWRKCYFFDPERMMECVRNRILVKGEGVSEKGVSEKGGESPLTFRQVIQSLKDYGDQYAAVMPVAKDAENSAWGIQYIWFEDGVLMLGQHDDEGLTCDLIAERIEKCVPSDLLDKVAVVKVGVTYQKGGVNIDVLTKYDEPAKAHTVQSSVVKPCRGNDWFCKWTLKFA